MPKKTAAASRGQVLHQTIELSEPQKTDTATAAAEKPDFWVYMQSLTADQWKDHIVYLTRELPRTTINGLGGYLVKLVQPFDIEEIKQAYGGQEFSYIMKRKNEIMYSGRFKIEAPAKLDATREVAGQANSIAPANDAGTTGLLQQFVGVLRDELQRSRENGGGTSDAAIEMVTKASDRAMEIITKQVATPQDPATQLLSTIELMNKIRPPAAADTTMNTLMMAVLPKLVERLFAPIDPLAQVTSLMAVFDKLNELRGDGGHTKRDWKQMALEAGMDALPKVLDTINRSRESAPPPPARLVPAAPATPGVHPQQPPHGAAAPAAPAMPNGGLRTVPLANGADGTFPQRAGSGDGPQAADGPGVERGSITLTTDQYNAIVKKHILEMVAMGLGGDSIVDYLDRAQPDVLAQIEKFTDAQLEMFFGDDEILAIVLQHPRWKEVLGEVREYMAEIAADDAAGGDSQSAQDAIRAGR